MDRQTTWEQSWHFTHGEESVAKSQGGFECDAHIFTNTQHSAADGAEFCIQKDVSVCVFVEHTHAFTSLAYPI